MHWDHPALSALADRLEIPLALWIRREARELTADFVLRADEVNPVELASQFGLTVRYEPGRSAKVIVGRRGREIVVGRGPSVRFDIAHELAHAILARRLRTLPAEILDQDVGHREAQEIEMLCNFGAAELLIPQDALHRLSHFHPFTLARLRAIAKAFRVSLTVAAKRQAVMHPGIIVVFWEKVEDAPAFRVLESYPFPPLVPEPRIWPGVSDRHLPPGALTEIVAEQDASGLDVAFRDLGELSGVHRIWGFPWPSREQIVAQRLQHTGKTTYRVITFIQTNREQLALPV